MFIQCNVHKLYIFIFTFSMKFDILKGYMQTCKRKLNIIQQQQQYKKEKQMA